MNTIDYFGNMQVMQECFDQIQLFHIISKDNNYYLRVSLDEYSASSVLYDEELEKRIASVRISEDDFEEDDVDVSAVEIALNLFEELDLILEKNNIMIEKIELVEDKDVLDEFWTKWMI